MKRIYMYSLVLIIGSVNIGFAQAPDTQWTARYNGSNDGDDWNGDCAVNAGFFYVVGSSWNGSTILDILTIKYNTATGDTQWTSRYDGPTNLNDVGTSCAVDNAGHIYVTGYSDDTITYRNDCLVIKYDAVTGETLWTRRYDGPDNDNDFGYGCASYDSTYLYVTGYSFDNLSEYDCLTIKYDAVTGETLWTRRYNGSFNGDDYAYCCAVDHTGNLYVTGRSHNGIDYDFLIIKYTPSGDTIWTRRYDSKVDYMIFSCLDGCCVDSADNIYVTGLYDCDTIANHDGDIFIIKYDASGDTVWTRRYGGTRYEAPHGCVMDGSGNLYVTGERDNGSNRDYITIKHDAFSGDTVWSTIYNGIGNTSDWALGCAVDEQDNLYVSGSSGGISNYDYLSIKYKTGVGVAEMPFNRPSEATYIVRQNIPNPFKGKTKITYEVMDPEKKAGGISLQIYDVSGRLVKKIPLSASSFLRTDYLIWDGKDDEGRSVTAGIYLYQIVANFSENTRNFSDKKKMILLK